MAFINAPSLHSENVRNTDRDSVARFAEKDIAPPFIIDAPQMTGDQGGQAFRLRGTVFACDDVVDARALLRGRSVSAQKQKHGDKEGDGVMLLLLVGGAAGVPMIVFSVDLYGFENNFLLLVREQRKGGEKLFFVLREVRHVLPPMKPLVSNRFCLT